MQVGNEQYPITTACCDAAIVTVRWLGFHRIWQGSGEVFDSIDLFLPDVQFGTQVRPALITTITMMMMMMMMMMVTTITVFTIIITKVIRRF